jgi:AcrR family transcriptional regulator
MRAAAGASDPTLAGAKRAQTRVERAQPRHEKRAQTPALYERLPCGRRGPDGLSREDVLADQRRRLQGAMVEAVARHGYGATTVSEVVALAGVSKKTLYRHYASKEECFLATHDALVTAGMQRIADAYSDGPDRGSEWTAALCRAFEAFVAEIATQPQEAWLALVEVLAAGPGGLERIGEGEARFARMIERSLALAPDRIELPPPIVRGVVHGLWYVARTRLIEHRPVAMADAGQELLGWMLSYRSSAASALGEPRAQGPPQLDMRGRCAAAKEDGSPKVKGDERTRLLRAAGRIAAAGGFQTLTGSQISDLAGVPETRFRELFESPEDCFLEYLGLGAAQALARALRETREAPDWPVGACRGLRSLLCHVAADPVLAQAGFVEIFAAGPAGARRRAALMHGFAEVLMRRAPCSLRPSPVVAEAITGSVWGILHHEVVRGRARALPALSGHAAYLALAPLIGGEAAVRNILAERARAAE